MRFYSFVNMYFIGIHAGIQTAHAVHEMELSYRYHHGAFGQYLTYEEWASKHKTIIVKRGGIHEDLQILYDELSRLAQPLGCPVILWKEPSANNCNTAVGIVLPESIYNCESPQSYSTNGFGQPGLAAPWSDEQKIKNIIDQYRMAM